MIQKLLPVLTFILFFLLFSIPVRDTDFGWHLRCGQEILEQGKLCQTNHFTTLLDNYRWHSPAHFYQILIFLVFKYFGFAGLTFFYALTAAGVFTFFIKSLGRNLVINAMITLAGIWFTWETLNIGLRSQILSVYFLLIYLSVIKLSQTQPKLLFVLPVLTTIWSNTHSGFFLGPIIALFLFVDALIKHFLKISSQKRLVTITILVCLIFIASLVSPYVFGTYQEVWRHSRVPLNTLIAEWVPPQAWQVFLTLSVAVWLGSLSWRKKDFFSILLLGFCTYLTVLARSNLPLFSVATVFSMSEIYCDNKYSSSWGAKRLQDPDSGQARMTGTKLISYLFLIFVSLIFAYKNLPQVLAFDENSYCQKALVVLPCAAVEFMNSQKPGNIFNAYEWGGYLIWKLPDFKIFVDGRMPSWDTTFEAPLPQSWRGKSPYTVYIETLQTQPGWEGILNNYETDYVVIQSGVYLDTVLKENGTKTGFKNIYNDGVASIYKKINGSLGEIFRPRVFRLEL